MWFVIDYLFKNRIDLQLFRVMPSVDNIDIWSGFGNMKKSDLQSCYANRVAFTVEDIHLGIELWKAYSKADLETLKKLATKTSNCYPLLKNAVEAHVQRFPLNEGRPQYRLKQILKSGHTDFKDIFHEFSKTEGVYGFGDVQVKKMLATL